MRFPVLPIVLLGALLAAPGLAAAEAANRAHPGQEADMQTYLRKGVTNIVDFYSEFCPPCRRISPLLEKLGEKRKDLAVVKVDINRPGTQGIDWGSPLARQYRLESIPHFQIYDGQGKLVQEGDGATRQVMTWLQQAGLGF